MAPPDPKLPDGTVARSEILVLVRGGDKIESVEAIALDKPSFPTLRVSRNDPVDVYAFLFSASLDTMHVHAGTQSVVAPGAAGSFLVATGALTMGGGATLGALGALYRTHIDGAPDPRWVALGESMLPPEVAAIKLDVPPAAACVDFDLVSFALDTPRSASFAIGIDDSTALGATEDGHFFEVSADHATRLVGLSTDTPDRAAYRDPGSGDIYMIGGFGELVRGHPRTGFMPAAGPQVTQGYYTFFYADLAGPSDTTSPFELYAASDVGTIDRYDGHAWTNVFTNRVSLPVYGFAVRLAWIAPQEAYGVVAGTNGILHVRGTAAVSESIASEDQVQVATTVAYLPKFGPMLGTNNGRLFRAEGGTWKEIVGSPVLLPITVIAPLDDGILFGGKSGALAQYHPAIGYCPPQSYAPFDIRNIVTIGPHLVLNSKSTHETITASFQIMTPRR